MLVLIILGALAYGILTALCCTLAAGARLGGPDDDVGLVL